MLDSRYKHWWIISRAHIPEMYSRVSTLFIEADVLEMGEQLFVHGNDLRCDGWIMEERNQNVDFLDMIQMCFGIPNR